MKKIILLAVVLALLFGCVENPPTSDVVDQNTSLNLVFDQNAVQINSVDVNLFAVAKTKKDVSVCEQITDSSLKSRCFFEFAIDTNNLELCKKVDIITLRVNCERLFFDLNK